MPKVTELHGYDLHISSVQMPVVENGQQVFDGRGAPKLETGKRLAFSCPVTGETYLVAMPAAAVRELAKALTGGIEIAAVAALPVQ